MVLKTIPAVPFPPAGVAKEGHCAEACSLYGQAAAWEKKALDQLSPDKVRTLGILGISLVSLLHKARDFAQAELTAQELPREPDLLPSARRELDTILQAIQSRQAENGSPAGVKDEARRL